MKPELEQQLFKKYPKIFAGKEEPITQNLMGFGFECDNGWYNLIDMLCFYLQLNIDHNNKEIENRKYPQIKAVQIKEKFGGLRFYTDYSSDLQQKIINFAELLSTTICEICGSPGKRLYLNGEYWVKTLCEDHAKELGYMESKHS